MGNVTRIDKNIDKQENEDYPDTVEIFSVDADLETGEVDEIDFYPEFDDEPPLMQLDLLKDVIRLLEERYAELLHEFGGTH